MYIYNSNIFFNSCFLYFYLMYETVIFIVCERAGWVTEKWVHCEKSSLAFIHFESKSLIKVLPKNMDSDY